MSVSTDGQICFGIKLEDDCLPWNEGRYQWRDVEDWWRDVQGYKLPFQMYNEEGNWLNGIEQSKERVQEYYDCQSEFDKEHPVPVKLVNYCSNDFPMYIVALPRTCLSVRRGYPEKFDPTSFHVTISEAAALVEFCKKYELPMEDEVPGWWLSSYWG